MVGLLIIIIQVLNLIAISYMVFKKREEPIYVIAWVMVMSFLPIVGFLFYLLFGRGPIVKKKVTFLDRIENEIYETALQLQREQLSQIQTLDHHYLSLIRFNVHCNKSILVAKNEIKLFSDAKDKYDFLIEDILRAKETINIMYFIIRNDGVGQALMEALTKKAKEGVAVRLVYDDGGSFLTPNSYFKPLIEAGGIVVKHYPAKFKIFTLNWNYRNHRKIVVIDGHIGYMGGMNIGDEYLSLNEKFSPWRDAHIRLMGIQSRYFKCDF